MTVDLNGGSPFSDCPLFGCGRTAPEVSEEEGSCASRFYRWFLESSKGCLLLLVALSDLIDTLAVASFKVPAMIVYDVAMKVLDTK